MTFFSDIEHEVAPVTRDIVQHTTYISMTEAGLFLIMTRSLSISFLRKLPNQEGFLETFKALSLEDAEKEKRMKTLSFICRKVRCRVG